MASLNARFIQAKVSTFFHREAPTHLTWTAALLPTSLWQFILCFTGLFSDYLALNNDHSADDCCCSLKKNMLVKELILVALLAITLVEANPDEVSKNCTYFLASSSIMYIDRKECITHTIWTTQRAKPLRHIFTAKALSLFLFDKCQKSGTQYNLM